MKRVFSLATQVACSFVVLATTTSALAKPASVFMLQFGSFESAQEANQRVDSLKTKHSGLLGNFPSRVQEVSLPDNLTVYRTQSGPVASRAEAQSICAQLASNGDECYVVETAMNMAPAATQVATASKPADVSFMKPKAAAPVVEMVDTDATPSKAPAVSPANIMPPLPKVEKPSTSMSAVKALESAPPISKATTVKEVVEQTEEVEVVNAPKAAPAKESKGFWASLNPFSDDEEDVVAVKAPAKEKMANEEMEVVDVTPELPEVKILEKPKAMEVVTSEPVINERPVVSLPVVPTGVPQSSEVASSLPLPPPPAMNSAAKEIFTRNQQEAPEITGTVPSIAPAGAAPIRVTENAPFAKASNETLARAGKPVSVSSGDGNVKVGEAQRVPVTNDAVISAPSSPMYVPSGSSVAPADASIPLRNGARAITPPAGELAAPEVVLPASQNMQKTLWAELAPYKDAASALAFWDKFRSKNPDFPVVRVRVIQSYAQKTRGAEDVALRVGPFAKKESIAYLCGQFKEVYSLKCGQVVDMGVSSSQTDARTRAMQGEANLATQSITAQNAPQMQGTYWLQLGTYPNLAQAQNTWGDLKQRYPNAMTGMNPNIAVPALSSGARPTYRLRGGPFATELAATKACLALKSAGGNCIVSGNTQ